MAGGEKEAERERGGYMELVRKTGRTRERRTNSGLYGISRKGRGIERGGDKVRAVWNK